MIRVVEVRRENQDHLRVQIRYHVDDDTGRPHIHGHGVSESEAEDVLGRPLENLPGRDDSRVVIGRTRGGRVLKVICVVDDDGNGVFVVTAFDLRGKPLAAFKRRLRKRGMR
jgi:hypothetical protein